MTVITVRSPVGRLDTTHRRALARSLTDAVLVPEVGGQVDAARAGFQVHFVELPADAMAIDGRLVADSHADIVFVDIAVMDGDWPPEVRSVVISRTLSALAAATDADEPAPGWWVNVRTIDDGSWGALGGPLTMETLLQFGLFTPERTAEIKRSLGLD